MRSMVMRDVITVERYYIPHIAMGVGFKISYLALANIHTYIIERLHELCFLL